VSNETPTTLVEAIRYFADPEVCVQYVARLRWPDGPVCPNCSGREHSYLTTRYVWKCKACKKQFSVKVGTIFEDSPIPLDKWLAAIWLIANAKNGISSYELARHTGMTQKSAWFVLHRIRLAMQTGSFDKFDGGIEVDESFIGGRARNMHKADKPRRLRGKTGMVGKTTVAGVLQRGGDVRATVIPQASRRVLHRHIREHVAEGATIYTDKHRAYSGLVT
jgi:transposase-like protein